MGNALVGSSALRAGIGLGAIPITLCRLAYHYSVTRVKQGVSGYIMVIYRKLV